jgi:hypothetical protein
MQRGRVDALTYKALLRLAGIFFRVWRVFWLPGGYLLICTPHHMRPRGLISLGAAGILSGSVVCMHVEPHRVLPDIYSAIVRASSP